MKWVKVSDRLPDFGREVLIVAGSDQYVAYLHDLNEYSREKARTRKDKYPPDLVFISGGRDFEMGEATHWMPLPELPEDIE